MWKWFIAIFGLSSCLVEYTIFEHPPTKKLITSIDKNSFQNAKEFLDTQILFVPSFRTLTKSFSAPESSLVLYSFEPDKSIFISSVTINGITTGYSVNLEIKKTLHLNEKIASSGVYYASLPLFNSNNIDTNLISQQEKITLIVYYAFPENITLIKKMTFDLIKITSKEIAWST
jgi:hypothetical protein